MAAKRPRPSRPKATTPRTEAQKQRRKDLWVAREADRQQAAEARCLARYEELKLEMARHGQIIGSLADVLVIEDPTRRFEIVKARVERWDALWSITLRKRDIRGKIVLGAALLAETAFLDPDNPDDVEFRRKLVDLLDRRVLRVRDRLLVRDLLSGATMTPPPLPLRPGGRLDEGLATALAAVGEGFESFESDALAMSVGDPQAELEFAQFDPAVAGEG